MRVRGALTLSALALVAVAGCTDPSPKPPPLTPRPTPSVSASPTSTSLPPEATKHTVAGGKAFVRAWVDELNRALASGDTDTLRTWSSRGCVGCESLIDAIDEVYSNDGHVVGGRWKLGALTAFDARRMQGPITSRPHKVVAASGEVTAYPGGTHAYSFQLKRATPGWLMETLVRAS